MTGSARPSRGRIDWEAVHRKLASAEPNPVELARAAEVILQERAARLALSPRGAESEEAFLELLTFERAGRRYAIESRFIVQVRKCGKLSRIPGAQPALLGVTNLGGDVLPVFDLARVADASHVGQPSAPQLVVLGAASPDLGLLADSVDQVSRVPIAALSPVSAVGALPHPEHLRGITQDACVVLDGEAVLRDRSVFVANRGSGFAPERE